MTAPSISVAVEGDSDEIVARRLLGWAGLEVGSVYVQRGKSRLDQKLHAFNQAAKNNPWLILRDLDQDAPCAPELSRQLLPARAVMMCFRLAVRAAEAWLLADRKNFSRFMGVPLNKITQSPDLVDNPKREVVNLARKSRSKRIRDDMVPPKNATSTVGPAYVTRLIEFTDAFWNPQEARGNSDSLGKCMEALDRLKQFMASSNH